ncbi:MAG: UMP kinase [Nitrososphaerales archaeon]|nr:UMP kinase [Nitrososphaerales archaeon]
MDMKIVLRIGGSIIGSPPDTHIIERYAEQISRLKKGRHALAIVVGGGPLSRQYIETADALGLEDEDKDELAILASRLNAKLLAKRLKGIAPDVIPSTIGELTRLLRVSSVTVMGGLKPGMTTDAVAAIVAKAIKANLYIKATDQEGVYTKDPKMYPEAKKIDRLTFEELSKMSRAKHKPGIHSILEPRAIRLLRDSGIKVIILNGLKPESVALAVRGKKIGTRIE